MRYRKLPVEIEAVRWDGSMAPVIELVGHDLPTFGHGGKSGSLRIATLEGDHECQLGDYIIKGIQGELYPCKPGIFEASYEPVSQEDAELQQAEHAHGMRPDQRERTNALIKGADLPEGSGKSGAGKSGAGKSGAGKSGAGKSGGDD